MYYVGMTIVRTILAIIVEQLVLYPILYIIRGIRILSIRTDILQKFYENNIILIK